VLSFPNCLLDVRTRRTFDPTPNFFTPYACGFDYNANAPKPVAWLAFLEQIFAGEYCEEQIRSLQEVMGYIVSSDNSLEKAFLLYGVTRSGKDTIKNMIRALLSPGSIAGPTLDSLAKDFGLSQLIGRALAIIGDARIGVKTDKDMLTENILKIVGRGFFTINRKYGSFWDGVLPVKLLILSNMLLKLIDESAAVAGRFITFRTQVSFLGREDPDLFERRLWPEREGVLLWALDGLRRVRENGRIYESPISVTARRQLARQSSSTLTFIEERLEYGAFASSTKD
jgi:putative DNA primase/helicase